MSGCAGVLRSGTVRVLVDDQLAAHVPGWTWEHPRAGIYAWLKHPGDPSEEIQHLGRHLGVQLGSGSALSLDDSHATYSRIGLATDDQTLTTGFGDPRKRMAHAQRPDPGEPHLV